MITPFWFKQRQCKVETAGSEGLVKVSGPNLAEAYLCVSQTENKHWQAALRTDPAGPDVAVAEAAVPTQTAAWEVAFELYRTHVIA